MPTPPTDVSATWGEAQADLPFLSKKETLKRYRDRIDGVKGWRDAEKYEKTWERLRNIYRLRMFENLDAEDHILVAVAFATINVIEPSVAINHPKITVEAASQAEADQAIIAEAVVNYWWQHYKLQPQFRRAVKDFLIYGHGWLKVGYRYVEGERQLSPEEWTQQHGDLAAQADQFAMENPHLADQLPSDSDIAQVLPATEKVPLEDRPFVERVSPFDMFVDPEATCLEDARWVVQRVVRPIEEVKHDSRYRAGVRRKLESDGSVKWQNSKSKNYVEQDGGRITLWEFYDLVRRTMCVLTETGDDFLVDPRPMPYTYGMPYVMLRDYDVPDQFYPIGELEALEPLQLEINETRTAMVRARKESIRKYVYRREALNPAALEAIRSDRDNAMIPIDSDAPLADVIKPLDQHANNAELYKQHSDVILADIDRVSAVSEYQRGELPEIRRTATEAAMVQDASNARASDKLATVEGAVASVASCLLQLAQMYMTGDQTARITGSKGTVYFEFKREDITAEFDFSVEAGSMQPHNETFRRQQAMQLAQACQPFIETGVIDPRKLAIRLLQDGFGIKDASEYILSPQPSKPNDKIIESMSYKDAPPDIQRQMESQAGLQPSQLGNMPDPVQSHGAAQGQNPPSAGAPNPADHTQQLAGQVGLHLGGGAEGPGAV